MLVLFLVLPLSVQAAKASPKQGLPTVVLLKMADEPRGKELERRFATQLELEIDGLDIEQVALKGDEFLPLVLKDKLSKIKELFKRRDVFSTVWIESGENNEILLHLVALSGNSAFVRVVSAPDGPDSSEELAFSAQVLLQQTYSLVGTGRQESDGPLRGIVVKTVSMDVAEEGQSPDRTRFGVMPFFQLNVSGLDAFRLLGGGLMLEGLFFDGLFFRIFCAVEDGPSAETSAGDVSGWTLQAGIELGYVWTYKKLSLGPLVGLSPYRYDLKMDFADDKIDSLVRWDLVSTLGLDIRISLTSHLGIVLDSELGIHGHTRDFMLENGSTVLSIPRLDAQVALGVLIAY